MLKELIALFDKNNPLKVSYDETAQMLETAQELFEQATRYVLEGRKPDFDLHLRDKELNKLHQDIRRRLLEHLSLNPRQDIVGSLVLLSVINDVERLGDYSKNIEELPQMPGGEGVARCVTDAMSRATPLVLRQFERAYSAFTEGDAEKAAEVMRGHAEIRDLCDSHVEEMFVDESVSRRCAVMAALYMRFLKRIGAHLKNICSGIANPFDMIGYTKMGREEPE
jgi:phosphate uptake regulator